ncbi:MAG: 4-phosphopantetheinyl transferase, partial [Mesorhizobium sp.]
METITIDQQNILVGIRPIEPGDESTLYDSEVTSLGRSVT